MGKKSAPPPPDYTKAAEATAASSQDAQTRADWANRPTINTPWGQESWQAASSIDPATGKPITSWTQNTTLNPQSQATLDATMNVDRTKAELAQGMLGRAAEATSNPFDWNNLQATGGVPQAGGLQAGNLSPGQQVQAGNLQAGNLQAGNLDPSGYQTSGAGQGLMAGLNTGALGSMPQADAQERQRIENMMFDRMRPEHQQAQASLEGKLANMGLTRGSAAWNKELQRMGDQQSRERFNAMEAGGNEMQRMFGMGMQGRQQGWNEMLGSGQFQNAAQAQGFGQNMAQNAQNFGQQAQAGAQNFGQQAQAGAQNFGQQAAAGAQNFGQQSQAANDWFQRQQAAGAQNFGQQQVAGNQNYNQAMQSANYQNQLRQQQIAEQQMQRQMPLNELNALLSGTQVGQLQTPDFNASRSAGGADYNSAASNQYQGAMDQYNAKQSQTQGMLSGLGSLASTAMMFSDARLKANIVRVGTHPVGVGVYEYDIGGQRQRGVIAQELQAVAPHLVHEHESGYLMVNYGGL